MSNHRVKATVRVVLDIEADSVWGSDCTFEQIEKQAISDVHGLLLNDNPLCLKTLCKRIKTLETIEVRVIKEK